MSVRDTCSACRCWSRRDLVFLALLLGFGLLLRFLGMSYGLPSVFHPDETRQVLDALSMGQRHSLLPVDHTYPALHKYLLLAVYGGYYFVGLLFGWFRSPMDFAVQYFAEPTMFYWLGRLLSVLAGTLLGAVLYLAGRRFYSTTCGWIAALFGLSMIHLVGHSQWALPDIFLTLTCTISICYLCAYMDSQRVSHAVLAGLWTGMAISTKYQGLFLLLPFVLAHVRVFTGSASRRALWRPVLWSAVTLALASLAGNLAWVFQYREIRQKFAELSGIGILGISSGETFSPGIASLLAWFARELVWQEGLLGVTLLAGAAYALYRHTARDLVALSFVALSLYALSGWGVRYLHLFVSTFGVLCLLGARLCNELLSLIRPARRGRLVGVISLAIVAGSLFVGARIDLEKSRPDTRETALEWVTTNIPAGTRIAVDWFELGPQLPGVTPVAVSNPRAVEYWENEVDPSLKQAYLQRTRGRTTYPLLTAMYATDQPAWPKEMPPEVVAKASAYPAVKHLYSRFNFYSLQQLKQQGAQYLVISSFAYCHFLLDDDPRKTGLFDPYGVEDTLANNRQAASYREDSFHGLLFYLVKNARDFYLPLLSRQRGSDFELVYEIRPTGDNWGPVVKIFRLP